MYVFWEDLSRSPSGAARALDRRLDVRVHIVAERVFVTAVDSEATDGPHGTGKSRPPSRRLVPHFQSSECRTRNPSERPPEGDKPGSPNSGGTAPNHADGPSTLASSVRPTTMSGPSTDRRSSGNSERIVPRVS